MNMGFRVLQILPEICFDREFVSYDLVKMRILYFQKSLTYCIFVV